MNENQNFTEEFNPNDKDPLFDEAVKIVASNQQGSTSLLQRKLNIGYNRANRIINQLETAGILGNFNGSKPREVLVAEPNELNQFREFNPNERDELFEEAARIVVSTQQGSTSQLQRELKLGYNRAGRIMDQLEGAGIVGAFNGAKAREVLIADLHTLEQILEGMR